MGIIQRALISVTDKSGAADLASALNGMGVEILSTGGTAKIIADAGVSVVEVSDFTGFPEMLDGRVKTLHPKVHAGVLFRRDVQSHIDQMTKHHLAPIDLVCVNLYAFKAATAKAGATLGDAIENIDIGGPTLLRAAAKNFAAVTVVVDPSDYQLVIDEMKETGGQTKLATRFYLARKVFATTAAYDTAISHYLAGQSAPEAV
jgi:phosphoribosylaminoimidazolecarboxamide formyltransferase/IMP cyclohydrolase